MIYKVCTFNHPDLGKCSGKVLGTTGGGKYLRLHVTHSEVLGYGTDNVCDILVPASKVKAHS